MLYSILLFDYVLQFDSMSQSSHVLGLFCARIEILYQSKQEMSLVNESSLCRLVLEWIRKQINEDNFNLAALSENTFMLYLAIDNSLQDANSLPSGNNLCFNVNRFKQF